MGGAGEQEKTQMESHGTARCHQWLELELVDFGRSPSKRLVRAGEGSPHVSHRTVVVSKTYFGLLEMAAYDVYEWLH